MVISCIVCSEKVTIFFGEMTPFFGRKSTRIHLFNERSEFNKCIRVDLRPKKGVIKPKKVTILVHSYAGCSFVPHCSPFETLECFWSKLAQKSVKIGPKSVQNRSKSVKNRVWPIFHDPETEPSFLSTHMPTFEKTGFSRRTGIRIAKITGFLDFGRLVVPKNNCQKNRHSC